MAKDPASRRADAVGVPDDAAELLDELLQDPLLLRDEQGQRLLRLLQLYAEALRLP